jgi:hypothetical protein
MAGRLVRVVGIDAYLAARYGRASSRGGGASVEPIRSEPAAAPVASSHRTSARRDFPIRTPLGLTSRFTSSLSE